MEILASQNTVDFYYNHSCISHIAKWAIYNRKDQLQIDVDPVLSKAPNKA